MRTAILQAMTYPDSDVPAVIRRAKTIARKAIDGENRDVLHYALAWRSNRTPFGITVFWVALHSCPVRFGLGRGSDGQTMV